MSKLILILILSVSLLIFWLNVKNVDFNSNNHKLTMYKLNSLQVKVNDYITSKISQINLPLLDQKKLFLTNKLTSLYIDSNIIEFLYSIIKLNDYNSNEFYLLLKGTNNILQLRNEIETYYKANNYTVYPENISEMLENALLLKKNCMNNLQNFIYTVPKMKIMYNYIDTTLVAYNSLLNDNIKVIQEHQKNHMKKVGIINRTKFIDLSTTKAFDAFDNHSIIPTKGVSNQLIDLYL